MANLFFYEVSEFANMLTDIACSGFSVSNKHKFTDIKISIADLSIKYRLYQKFCKKNPRDKKYMDEFGLILPALEKIVLESKPTTTKLATAIQTTKVSFDLQTIRDQLLDLLKRRERRNRRAATLRNFSENIPSSQSEARKLLIESVYDLSSVPLSPPARSDLGVKHQIKIQISDSSLNLGFFSEKLASKVNSTTVQHKAKTRTCALLSPKPRTYTSVIKTESSCLGRACRTR